MRSYSASVRSLAYSWVAMPQHSKHHCLSDSSFQTGSELDFIVRPLTV